MQQLVVLCGLVGSGKSTFARAVEQRDPNWTRCNQDELGRRQVVEKVALDALDEGRNVLIDRTNIDRRQRADWLLLAEEFRKRHAGEGRAQQLEVALLFFDVSFEECQARLAQRMDHPTLKTPQQALRVLGMFRRSFVPPLATEPEGFDRMLTVRSSELHAAPLVDGLLDAAFVEDVLRRLQEAPKLPRAGEAVYANQPRVRPGSSERGRPPRGRGAPRGMPPGSRDAPRGAVRGATRGGSRIWRGPPRPPAVGPLDAWMPRPTASAPPPGADNAARHPDLQRGAPRGIPPGAPPSGAQPGWAPPP